MSSDRNDGARFESSIDDSVNGSTVSRELPYDAIRPQRDPLQPTLQLVGDIQLASQCDAGVLITSTIRTFRRSIAESIHTRGERTGPLIVLNVRAILDEGERLEGCTRAMTAAALGTLYLDYDGPATIALLQHIVMSRSQVTAPRLIVGTGVNLFPHVVRGSFPESLYYRLNSIHIVS